MPTSIIMSEEVDIQWGTIKSYTKTKTFYSSFISERVEYELFDNVEVYNGSEGNDSEHRADPYIGKIVKLWEEKETGMRKVLIRWFFRLKDLDKEMEGDPRELYLAFGMGKGVTNENDLEVICGKSKVLCTSKDARNWQPSAKDLKNADFFFSKIYNVDLQHVSPVQRVVDKLGCEAVYNKPEWVTEIPKNKEKAVEQLNSVQDCKRVSTLKRKAECMGDSPSDLKDKQRGTDVINDTQQKACQGSDLTMQQSSSMNKVTQNKNLKTSSATTSPPTEVDSPSDLKDKQRGTDVINDTQQKACQGSELSMQQSSSVSKVTQNKKLKTSATTSPTTKGDSPSDLKGKQRSTDVINDTQQKACQGSDLTMQQSSSMNKATQNKKLKKSATTSPPTKGDSPSDLKDKQRGTDVTNDTQQKGCQGSDLIMQRSSSMNDLTQNKKLKTSAIPSSPKKVATANRLQKSENTSSSGEVVASKIPTSGDFVRPSSKVDQEELQKTDLLSCALAQTNLNTSNLERPLASVKTSVSETASLKVDDALGQQAGRQLDEKGRAENLLVKETFIDAQKITEDITEGQTNFLTQAKRASGLLKEKEDKNLHEKIEMNSSASNSRVKGELEGAVQADHKVGISLERKGHQVKGDSSSLLEPGNGLKETVVKEFRPEVSKKPLVSTGSVLEKKLDSEKKLFSTTEPVRVAENWKIFKELPWEQNLQQGILSGRVLLLQNLDPCLTSADARDLLKNVLQGVADIRIIPQETLCPHAQALAIFESKLLAESALQEMERKCLVMANNRRPIVASKFKEMTNFSKFPGHLALEKLKLSRNLGAEDYKKAVSTSHCSQPNTIEYEMAMEWRRLQEIIQTCRAELFEKQRKEMEEIRKGHGSEGH